MPKSKFSLFLLAFLGIIFSMYLIKTNINNFLGGNILDSKKSKSAISSQEKFRPLTDKKLLFTLTKDNKKIFHLNSPNQIIPLQKSKLKDATSVANQFFKEYGQPFGIKTASKELSLFQSKKDKLGMNHLRYVQKYNGVPVFGGGIILHLNSDLSVNSANGKILDNISSVKTKPKITEKKAKELAKALWKKQFKSATGEPLYAKLSIFNKKTVNPKAPDKNYLVWEVPMIDKKIFKKEFFYISAQDGKLVSQLAGVQSIDRKIYDCSGTQCQISRQEGNRAVRNNEVNTAYNTILDAHNYFLNKFNLDGANGQGGTGVLPPPAGAFANFALQDETYIFADAAVDFYGDAVNCGRTGNAYWFGWGIVFCPNWINQTSAGHEFTHGVYQFNGPQVSPYQLESGAIMEAFSDIFGIAVNYAVNGGNDWTFTVNGNKYRDLADPLNLPDKYFSPNMRCLAAGEEPDWEDNDLGWVHFNNTTLSHAAYLMAEGDDKTDPADASGCSINGIGRDKTERIFYKALTDYLPDNPNFNEVFYAIDAACNALYNNLIVTRDNDPSVCPQVKKALQAVELDQWGGTCEIGNGAVEREPSCAAPYITSINSMNLDGNYHVGDQISITINFSKPVYSTNTLSLMLNTGTLKYCTVPQLNGEMYKTCQYTVQENDQTDDLDVTEVLGIIKDENHTSITNFIPVKTLAENKNIAVDGRVLDVGDNISQTNPAFDLFTDNELPNADKIIDNKIPEGIKNYLDSNEPITNTTPLDQELPTIPAPPAPNPFAENIQDIDKITEKPKPKTAIRFPNFDFWVENQGNKYSLTGIIKYYGIGGDCEGPRYFDPVIVAWGRGNSEPIPYPISSGIAGFEAEYSYENAKNPEYNLSVSVISSCFGSTTKRIKVTPNIASDEEATNTVEYCTKKETGEKMIFVDARQIAETSACVEEGLPKTGSYEKHWCNEETGTWWISMDIKKDGCNPACVVDIAKKTAEMNWMCTGVN